MGFYNVWFYPTPPPPPSNEEYDVLFSPVVLFKLFLCSCLQKLQYLHYIVITKPFLTLFVIVFYILNVVITNLNGTCPPLWARLQHARLSRSGPGFDPRSGQVSWVRFFQCFSSPVRQMSESFRPPWSPNIIWPSLSSSLIIIHYGRQ